MRNKRHTKPCVYFQTNECPLTQEQCGYVHVMASREELDSLKTPQATLRTKPCRFYLAGQCKDGYWCRFKHPASSPTGSLPLSGSRAKEISTKESKGQESINNSSDVVDVRDVDPTWQKLRPFEHPKYRTRPCRNFILGRCSYGDRCSYLHATISPTSSGTSSGFISPSSMYLPLSPPVTAGFALSPIPYVPPPTPVGMQQSPSSTPTKYDKAETDPITQTLVKRSTGSGTCTPSNSSLATEEPITPETSGGDCFPLTPSGTQTYPFTPPPSTGKGKYNVQRHLVPYTIYSPTSPVPMTILHVPVPVALHMCQTSQDDSELYITSSAQESYRHRSQSQPHTSSGTLSPRGAFFKTKPCRFYIETGTCYKGDRCNFIHPEIVAPQISHSLGKDNPRDNEAEIHTREQETDDSSPAEERPNNFYKINWRVVGGGVMMGSDDSGTTHKTSADTSIRPRPGLSMHLSSGSRKSLDRRHVSPSKPKAPQKASKHTTRSPTPSSSAERRNKNALVLNLQSHDQLFISGDSAKQSVIAIQGDGGDNDQEEMLNWGDCSDAELLSSKIYLHDRHADDSKTYTRTPALHTVRAKSSPSSPVTTRFDTSVQIFPAESP